jgi:hypothetical protein
VRKAAYSLTFPLLRSFCLSYSLFLSVFVSFSDFSSFLSYCHNYCTTFVHPADEKWALESLVSPIDPSRNTTGSSTLDFDSVTSSVILADGGSESITSVSGELDEEARYIEESMKRDIAASLGKGKSTTQSQVGHCRTLRYPALLCTILYCIILDCTILHCTELYLTALYHTALHCTVLHAPYRPTRHCTAPPHTMLYYTALHNTILHCTIILHYTIQYCAIESILQRRP